MKSVDRYATVQMKVLGKPDIQHVVSRPRIYARSYYAIFCISYENFLGSHLTDKHRRFYYRYVFSTASAALIGSTSGYSTPLLQN